MRLNDFFEEGVEFVGNAVAGAGKPRPYGGACRGAPCARPFRAEILMRLWVVLSLVGAAGLGAAEVAVSGLGFWGNREARAELRRLHEGDSEAPGASAVEDMAFVLLADLEERGYLRPRIQAVVTRVGGGEETFVFDAEMNTLLPRPFPVAAVRFRIDPGVRYEVRQVSFEGLSLVSEGEAEAYFLPRRLVPLGGADERAYSPGSLRRSAFNLQAELEGRGHAEALVEAEAARVDDKSGRVEVIVTVAEGARWEVVALEVTGAGEEAAAVVTAEWTGRPWSDEWARELAEWVRRAHFRAGYADVRVKVSPRAAAAVRGRRAVTAEVAIEAGPKVTVSAVRFEGAEHTRERLLERRARVKPGRVLDPVAMERARRRLARLGVFSRVDVGFVPDGAEEREVVFAVEEAPLRDAHLLMGYGSYEQLRGGVEFTQTNLWGLAHQSRLLLVQSFKSSQGDYTYSVPGLFGEALDGSARVFGLRREEQAFTREELGVELILRRSLGRKVEANAGYRFEALKNAGNELTTRFTDDEVVRVASLNFGLSQDRRDHALRPTRGWRWFGQLELAERELGGEVDYQRWELGASWHRSAGRGRWVHAGLVHGGVATAGFDGEVPVNRLFFPGGENSIRGYQSGEASPRGADGRFVGAESYVLVNLELEQALTRTWSLVVFADGLGTAAKLGEYPFDEELFSAGLGVRYNTLLGPVRLEYGHNLNPRAGDPAGTLHFSVGFPF